MIKKKKNNGEEKTFFFLSQREQSIIDTRNQVSQSTSYRNTQQPNTCLMTTKVIVHQTKVEQQRHNLI